LKWLYRIVGGAPNDGIEWVLFPFVLILTSVTLALVIIAIGLIPILVLGVAWLMVWFSNAPALAGGPLLQRKTCSLAGRYIRQDDRLNR
jgi:hypothetical protein